MATRRTPAADFLQDGGEMGALTRAFDWASHPLGLPEAWPQPLKTVLRLIFNTGHPMYVWWGDQHFCFYNDAYRQSIGPERHPSSLGKPAKQVWEEIWPIIGPQIDDVMAGRGATWHENALVPITRNGKREDVYWTYSYGPIDDDAARNGVGGVLVVCTETTAAVRAEQDATLERERLQQLFEQSPSFMAVLRGPDHRFEYANPGYYQLIGHRQVIGMSVAEALPEAASQGYVQVLDEVYASGQAFVGRGSKYTMEAAPGAPPQDRVLDFVYQPIRNADGKVDGIFVEGVDVTEHAQAGVRTKALAELSDVLRDVDDPDDIAFAAAEILARTLGVSRAGYGTIDTKAETISIERDWNMPGVQSLAGVLHFRDYGSYIEDLKRGVTVVVADAEQDPRTASGADALKAISAHSFVNMPVNEQGDFVALLYLNHAAARTWSDEDILLIREVAQRTRSAVARRQAEMALQKSEERLRFLDALAQETAKLADADAVLRATTQMLGEKLAVSVCAYADMDADQNGFTIRGEWFGPGARSILGRYKLADFGALALEKLSAGLPLIIQDNLAQLAPEEAVAFQALGIRATICVPLIKRNLLVALMAVHDSQVRQWSDDDLVMLREVTERSWAHVERAGAEADLRESELRYRALFNAIDEGFCIIEFIDGPHGPLSDYVHVEANPAYALNAGIENVVGRKVRDMVGAEADDWVALYSEVLRTGQSIRFERELEATGRWLELAAFRIEPASRRQVAVLFQDLTARKQAELALSASEASFRTLTRAMPNQAWTAKPDGMLDWFNDQVYAFSGAAVGALDGAKWAELVHPEDLPGAIERWTRALSSGETYEVEFRLRRDDGEYRWHLARAAAILDETGAITRWIGTNTDVHDQKAAAEALAEFAATLEERVEERSNQLMVAEEALRQAQKMEAVGQLTGGIAHDFNNLLAAIIASLSLIERRLVDGKPGVDRYISGAKESAQRAANLTQRLLAFSRRQTLDPVATDVNKLIGGMEDLIRRTVGPDVEVEVVGAGGLWATRVDRSQLENSLLNLCINGRDAMAPNGGRLTIETANKWLDQRAAKERDLPAGQYVSLCVTDTGTGMSPEIIERAFDPFFTTKPLGQGTGLGLSMIYGFVRQSGGQVRIYSELGKGTTMCLYLPRFAGRVEEDDAAVRVDEIDVGDGESILVIDDEAVLRMLITDVLQDAGYRVSAAGDGPSGLKIVQSDARIDLLITDVGLPGGMNGRQVADAARALRPNLKVLFITGYAENAAIGNGHLDPGMEIITKPFEIAALGARVREMLEE